MPADPAFGDAVAWMERATEEGVASAVVVQVSRRSDGACLFAHAVGRVSADLGSPSVGLHSRFDLASITKAFTAVAVLRLVERSVLSLSDDVGAVLGEAPDGGHAGMTLRHLLEHDSGLPAWRPLHADRDVVQAALRVPAEAAPGARHIYSDVGFLVLDAALRRRVGRSAAELVRAEVLEPLALTSTGFRGVGQSAEAAQRLLATGDFVACEVCPDRGLLVGEVSDENAHAMGGAAPHAGLFGTAADLAAFGLAVLAGPPLLAEPTRRALFEGRPSHAGGHLLGWDTIAPQGYTSAGRMLSPRSRGHLGFTGPSLWLDPDRGLAFVVLANRVHPSRDEARWKPLRPILHDALSRAADSMQ